MKIFAGVGARNTPKHVLDLMFKWAGFAATQGFICSTGGALGADQAFANGALSTMGATVHLHIPWSTYEKSWWAPLKHIHPNIDVVVFDKHRDKQANASVDEFHPNPLALKSAVRALHARNYNILFYRPVEHVVCYTNNGEVVGGTGQAIRLATSRGVPVYNLGNKDTYKAFATRLAVAGITLGG